MQGFLLADKEEGISSFAVIRRLRRITGVQKIGHAGTLDPFASGLLIIAIGRSHTRQIHEFQALPKRYTGTIQLGRSTDTLDPEGELLEEMPEEIPDLEAKIKEIIPKFTGYVMQTPPSFSAKKVDGKRAYKLARQGDAPILDPVEIYIHDLSLKVIKSGEFPVLEIQCQCSKGTYVRQLAADIAKALGSIGYLATLRRTAIGDYSVDSALNITDDTEKVSQQELFHALPNPGS